jgi:5-methylthioribose kinase
MIEIECLVSCESTAMWRRRKQDQYPEDQRNSRAAEILDALEKEVKALEGSEIHKRLIGLWSRKKGFSEIVSESLRAIGFYSFPECGQELLETIAEVAEEADDLEDADYI